MYCKEQANQLRTTHYADQGKPHTLCTMMVINGRLSLAYFKGKEILSYIPWEEASKEIYRANLPQVALDF